MSHEASSWAFAQQQPELATGAKFLLVAIANRADKSGVAWPGHKTLAHDCNCAIETVTPNMKRLEALGLLVRIRRRRKNGSRTSDWIVLAAGHAERLPMIDAPADEYPEEVASVARAVDDETSPNESSGDLSSPEDSTRPHLRKTGGPEPSEEPSTSEPSSLSPSGESSGSDVGGGENDHITFGAENDHRDQRRTLAEQVRAALDTKHGRPDLEIIEELIAGFPDRDHLAVAERGAHWIEHEANATERLFVAGAYRTFLERAERVAPKRMGSSDWVRENLPELDPTTIEFGFASVAANRLLAIGEPFTPDDVRAAVERRCASLAA